MQPRPNFRRAQSERAVSGRRGPPHGKADGLLSQLAGLSLFAALIGWQLGPQLQASLVAATGSESENRVREGSAFYRNCDAARAAGAAPLYRGQPGYRPQMDGDSDGIACELYRGR